MSTDDKDIDIYIKEYYNDYYDNELTCTMGNMLEKLNKLNIKFSDSSLSGHSIKGSCEGCNKIYNEKDIKN